jgi:hypothetical protein
MLKHRASGGPAELQWGSTLIQETPGVRQSYSCVALQRHRLSVISHAVVYVLDGEVEMQVRGGTLRRLGSEQVFYESPEDVHTVSRNASKTKPAKFVVFLSKMKEHRFSLPFTSFGREQCISPMKPLCLKQYSFRGGTYEFTNRATHREWDRDCPSVRTVCASSFLSIRCG